jgi:hypothetical protein
LSLLLMLWADANGERGMEVAGALFPSGMVMNRGTCMGQTGQVVSSYILRVHFYASKSWQRQRRSLQGQVIIVVGTVVDGSKCSKWARQSH